MELIQQSVKVLFPTTPEEGIAQLKQIEYAGRNCYRSQDKITDDSYEKFIHNLIKRGHHSPLEFAQFSVELTTSRDVLAEITRHRLASFAVESQRYVNESKESGGIKFIVPEIYKGTDEASRLWQSAMALSENAYNKLIDMGWKNQDARKVLPNSTACVICMTANLREWIHIFDLRTSVAAYPEIRHLMDLILIEFNKYYPNIYERIDEDDKE